MFYLIELPFCCHKALELSKSDYYWTQNINKNYVYHRNDKECHFAKYLLTFILESRKFGKVAFVFHDFYVLIFLAQKWFGLLN